MFTSYFNTIFFVLMVLLNWTLHFIVNDKRRKKKGLKYELTGKSLLAEFVSFIVVLFISYLEVVALIFLYKQL